MKFWISTLAVFSLLFVSCSAPIEEDAPVVEEPEEVVEVAEVVLAAEAAMQKVTFASEDETYLYSFSFDSEGMRYLGYELEGMSPNGGAFLLLNGAEIVTSTLDAKAVGLEEWLGDRRMYTSTQEEGACMYEYRVIAQSTENLMVRGKSCDDQDPDHMSRALDVLLDGLTIDEL